jgi:hypothetical protein
MVIGEVYSIFPGGKMKSDRSAPITIIALLVVASLVLASCTPAPTTAPTQVPTRLPTPIPLPRLSLVPGEFYFRLDEKPSFIFSRNIGGSQESNYGPLLSWSVAGGSRIVRVYLRCLGPGYTSSGGIDELWISRWERIFDRAAADGIYVLPILTGWGQWDINNTEGDWLTNPFNAANGGPTQDPLDIFRAGSETQNLWLAWMEVLVRRWKDRPNIAAWEIFGEVNCGNTAETDGIALINTAASRIRAIDPGWLLTSSRCESGSWPNLYTQADIDFVEVHPYPVTGQLDRNIITLVRQVRSTYHKPVLIGESGLHFARPDFEEGKVTVAEHADRGIHHAIWAGIVSGAMNGRALWWEDGYGIYFSQLGMPWMERYSTVEIPAGNFVQDVDFSGFTPLTSTSSPAVWGAAVGNESMVLGWYRDAASEPPDWNIKTIPAGKTVTITVQGKAADWQVDLYDTSTGTTILSSTSVTRHGNTVTVTLPEFQDDIAFKMMAGTETSVITPEVVSNTNGIAGTWSGTISNEARTFSTRLELSIQTNCKAGNICGTFTVPQLPCSGKLFLQEIDGKTYIFIEQNATGAESCTSGGYEYLQLKPDGTLDYRYAMTSGSAITSSGILNQP